MNFFLFLNIKEDILKNVAGCQKIKRSNCLATKFCFQQKKEIYTGLEQLEGKGQIVHFCVIYFKCVLLCLTYIIFFSGSRDCADFANNSRIHIFFPPGFQAATRALIHHCSDSIYSNSPFLCFCFHNAHKQQSYTHILIAHLTISRFAWIRLLFGEGPWVSHPPEATHT